MRRGRHRLALVVAVAWLTGVSLARAASGAGGSGEAAEWSAAFATETDTTVFLTVGGRLFRAPFSLAARETLWAPAGEERVARFRVSPDGRRVAWLGRAGDQDTTRLWVAGPDPGAVRVRFSSLQPSRFNILRYEPATPTLEDPTSHGARLVQGSALSRRFSVNPIAWTADGGLVAFGYDDGLAVTRPDTGIVREVSKALVIDLVPLEPSTIFLARTLVIHETRPEMVWYLLYPSADHWKLFPTSGLEPSRRRAVSPGAVWWVDGHEVRAVRVHDPSPSVEVEADEPVSWIGYDPASRILAIAAGSAVLVRPEDGGSATRAFGTAHPIRRVLEPPLPGARWGFVSGDSLLLWRPGDLAPRGLKLDGLDPQALFVPPAAGGDSSGTGAPEAVFVLGQPGGRGPLKLARAEPDEARLTPLETPKVRNAMAVTSPSGRFLMLFEPEQRAPGVLEVCDLTSGRWTRVLNPGLIAWEPAPGW